MESLEEFRAVSKYLKNSESLRLSNDFFEEDIVDVLNPTKIQVLSFDCEDVRLTRTFIESQVGQRLALLSIGGYYKWKEDLTLGKALVRIVGLFRFIHPVETAKRMLREWLGSERNIERYEFLVSDDRNSLRDYVKILTSEEFVIGKLFLQERAGGKKMKVLLVEYDEFHFNLQLSEIAEELVATAPKRSRK